MPSTPTVTLTADTTNDRVRVAVDNPGTNPDHNEIWRRVADEYDGAFIPVTKALPPDSTFDDYGVPAGKQVDWFARAVDTGGATADSLVKSVSLTLADDLRLHRVAKNASSNITGTVLRLLAGLEYRFRAQFEEELTEPLGVTEPVVNIGTIEMASWEVPVIVPASSDVTRTALKAMFAARSLLCMRSPTGLKAFGVLRQLRERYLNTLTEIPLAFEQLDFNEAVE